jgi:SWI/SNF-related matrix-associated actin-dependent regulator of chromatin subfamily A protein 2/4
VIFAFRESEPSHRFCLLVVLMQFFWFLVLRCEVLNFSMHLLFQGMTHHHERQQTHQSGAPHGTMGQGGGSNFPQSSSPMPPVQSQMNLLPYSGPQGMVGGQVHNQVAMQQYLKLVMQQQQMAHGMLLQQQAMNMLGSSSRDQDMINNPAKMHELMALQVQMFKRQPEHLQQAEKQKEQGQPSSDEQRNRDMRSPMPPPGVPGQQLPSAGMMRPMQPMQGQVGISSTGAGPLTPLQFQAIQAWAKDNNFDLSNPANMSAISQLLPIWQSSRLAAVQKQNEASMAAQQQAMPSQVNTDTSGRGSVPNQGAPSNPGQPLPPSSVSGGEEAKVMNSGNLQLQQQLSARNRDGSNERAVRLPVTVGDGRQMMMHIPQSSGHVSKVPEQSTPKIALANSEAMQVQHGRQMQQPNQAAAPTASPGETGGSQAPIPSARLQTGQTGFTKNQLHVLKAQIIAFRHLKVK